jgi:protein subunit release factor A
MAHFKAHEVMELQEHIRSEAATAQTCRKFAEMATDPDLKQFCQQEARTAETNLQKLMSLFHHTH